MRGPTATGDSLPSSRVVFPLPPSVRMSFLSLSPLTYAHMAPLFGQLCRQREESFSVGGRDEEASLVLIGVYRGGGWPGGRAAAAAARTLVNASMQLLGLLGFPPTSGSASVFGPFSPRGPTVTLLRGQSGPSD